VVVCLTTNKRKDLKEVRNPITKNNKEIDVDYYMNYGTVKQAQRNIKHFEKASNKIVSSSINSIVCLAIGICGFFLWANFTEVFTLTIVFFLVGLVGFIGSFYFSITGFFETKHIWHGRKLKDRIAIPFETKQSLFRKAGGRCSVCKSYNNHLEIHHLDSNPSNNSFDNLQVVCPNCHKEVQE